MPADKLPQGTARDIRVESVNVGLRKAFLSDGQIVPITDFLGPDGEITGPEDAVVLVCGVSGLWLACSLDDFDPNGARH